MSDREPTPAEEQVRRLLADARHREPVPPDVAERLDHVLEDLVAERAAGSPGAGDVDRADAPGDEVAARRRRRRVGYGLLAAAAATVVGLSVPAVLESGRDLAGSTGTADSGEAGARAQEDASAEAGSSAELAPEASRPPAVRDASFDRDVERAVQSVDRAATRRDGSWCPIRAAWGEGEIVPVRYEGDRAVLVVREPGDGARRVDLFPCGSDTPADSTTIDPR